MLKYSKHFLLLYPQKKKKKTHCEVWLSPANISIPKMRKQTEILNSFPNVIQLVSGKNVSKRIVIKLL